MIIFVNVKNGKVDLTKEQFERILKEKYNEGYNDGKKVNTFSTWGCPYYSWHCPYRPSSQTPITWCGSTTGASTTATTTTTASASNKITLTSSNTGDIATSGYVDTSDGVKINYHEVT